MPFNMYVAKYINTLTEKYVFHVIVGLIITEKCADKSPRGVRGELLKYVFLHSLLSAI